jgi:sugar phosphate isomerase/epimerase
MQGRLSPGGPRAQSFPSHWQAEFADARTIGFDRIEWLLTEDDFESNPLWTAPQDILRCAELSGVTVTTLCADVFIHRGHDELLLAQVLARASGIGIDTVIVPWLEANTAGEDVSRERLRSLRQLSDTSTVRIAIESDLSAGLLRTLIEECAPSIGICYDTGNAAAAGHDLTSDLNLLGPRLFAVHVKDRVPGSPSVPLGQGRVDFAALSDALAAHAFRGPLILETPRTEDPLRAARTQRDFLIQHLAVVTQP